MSGSQNRSCCNIIYRLGLNIVMLLTLLLSMLLFAGSFLTTCYADNMETQQVLLRPDNPLWNLLELTGFGLLFCGCLSLYEKIGEKFRRGLLVFTLTFVFVLGILLILFGRTVPAADALSVYNAAAEWILGNTDIIHPTVSYLSYYPQQIGLMAFLELLLRIWNLTGLSVPAWHFIKLVYVCLLCGAIWFQYLSLQYLWPENYKKISCCYLVLVCCNLPMIMYSSFVYGEIPSFVALSVGCYLLLRLLGSVSPDGSYRDNVSPGGSSRIIFTGFGSILFLTLSVMLRKNSLIPIIAVLLVLLFEALRFGRSFRSRLCLLGIAVCLAVTSVGILPLVQKCYEKKAGNTLSSGVTAMSYLAMGMQEASRGCGWYNGFNIDTYDTAGMDTALANEISRLAIDERLTYFREHPGYTADFYLHKHLSQWADGTYASRQATLATYGGRSAFFKEVYEGSLSGGYIEWCNAWQNVLYLGVLVFCIGSLKNRRKSKVVGHMADQTAGHTAGCTADHMADQLDADRHGADRHGADRLGADRLGADRLGADCHGTDRLYVYVGLIAVLGGFLFHTFWEANSRYIFSYSLLLMPYCGAGVYTGICRIRDWVRSRFH
ncbi:glycosyltransferase family protein [Waltera intestinalis]|uniref:Uncharacterized protein n=1 Tax=Waltera intestinalis TaxID=2606635 RepID=A0A6L5YMG4_9FIRM|nr:hypothetical protein [Waltera intestinalis]MST59140.1 hypothetical protein [Waltera intestinalis]